MPISDAKATFGLSAVGTPVGTGLSGTLQIGSYNQSQPFADADVAYSMRAIFAGIGDVLALDILTGSTSGSTAWVAGAAQVETATAAGTITGSGDASVVVTAAGMTGSPKTISVAVTSGDTAAVWAGKVRTALEADTAVSAMFTVEGTTTAIALRRKPTATISDTNIYAADDATLNISLDNGTCTGITTAATSANTTAGVATDGVLIYDGDGKDFEGVALETIAKINAILIEITNGDALITGDNESISLFSDQKILRICGDLGMEDTTYEFSAASETPEIKITVVGTTA